MVYSLCNYRKTVNQLLLEDITTEIAIEYRPSEKTDELLYNNDDSMSHLKGELANTNQLLSNFRNKNSTCFLQGDAFSLKPLHRSVSLSHLILETTMKATIYFKGGLQGLRKFLASENPLKRMKNAFYFTLKAVFFLKIFKYLS